MGLTGQNANQCNVDVIEADDFKPVPKTHVRNIKQRQVRLAEKQILELIKARLAGRTINELATEFGVHRTTVMRHLKRNKNSRRGG